MTSPEVGVPELDGAPLFLLEVLPDTGELLVDGPEGRHAVEVLRLTPGERVRVGDGQGAVAEGDVVSAGAEGLRVAVRSRLEVPAPNPEFVLVQALPKGDRGPLAVELATELGVDRIVPWTAARCVTRWRDDRIATGVATWRAAARTAAKQARRPRVPDISEVVDTAGVVARLSAPSALGIVLHESAELPLSQLVVPSDAELVLVVGPEGGISDDELAAFRAGGATAYGIGPTVLRTSTAGTVAAAVVLARSGRLDATKR